MYYRKVREINRFILHLRRKWKINQKEVSNKCIFHVIFQDIQEQSHETVHQSLELENSFSEMVLAVSTPVVALLLYVSMNLEIHWHFKSLYRSEMY